MLDSCRFSRPRQREPVLARYRSSNGAGDDTRTDDVEDALECQRSEEKAGQRHQPRYAGAGRTGSKICTAGLRILTAAIENAVWYSCTVAAGSGERPGAALMGADYLFVRENGFSPSELGHRDNAASSDAPGYPAHSVPWLPKLWRICGDFLEISQVSRHS